MRHWTVSLFVSLFSSHMAVESLFVSVPISGLGCLASYARGPWLIPGLATRVTACCFFAPRRRERYAPWSADWTWNLNGDIRGSGNSEGGLCAVPLEPFSQLGIKSG